MLSNFDLLKQKFNLIKRKGWIKSYRKGYTGIGYTFESLIGKSEDSLCYPDFLGIEIKTHRVNSKAYISLFNYNPIGESSYELKRIFNQYGYFSQKYENLKILNACIYSKYKTHIGKSFKFSLRVDDNTKCVYLLIFDKFNNLIDEKSYWTFETLKEKLYTKIKYLAFIETKSRIINGNEFFKYENIHFYALKDFDTFINLLKIGKIKISFLINAKVTSVNNNDYTINTHGTSFSIKSENLNLLFNPIKK